MKKLKTKKWKILLLNGLLLPIIAGLVVQYISDVNILLWTRIAISHFSDHLIKEISIPIWLALVLVLIFIFLLIYLLKVLIKRTKIRSDLKTELQENKPKSVSIYNVKEILSNNYIPEPIRLTLLGFQNGGGLIAYKRNICGPGYEPGTFRLSEISLGNRFIKNPKSFDGWLDEALEAEIYLLNSECDTINNILNQSEVKKNVRGVLESKTDLGYPLKHDIWYQEYSDVLRRIILFSIDEDPDRELEIFPNLTINRKNFIIDVVDWIERNKKPDLREWLQISIAAGLMGVNEKSIHAATSEINRIYTIHLNSNQNYNDQTIERVGKKLYDLSLTKCSIDASDWLFQILNISQEILIKIVSFPDDYIETIFLLKFYQELFSKYKNILIDCIPRMIRCGNDVRYKDFEDLLTYFQDLKENPLFKVHQNGPKLGTINLMKLHPNTLSLIEDCDFIDARGARNFEMMQGVNKDTFFGFMVCREFSEATTGLLADERPLIFIKQPAGERSFEGFRERYLRKINGTMLCKITVKDNEEKWSGGHLGKYKDWDSVEKDRYRSIQRFYSKSAKEFHIKFGDLLETEVKTLLSKLSGRVLVLGCGTGKEVGFLCDHGCDAVGIDISAEAITNAKIRFPHLWNRFYIEDFYNILHFKSGYFDAIVANASLVHLLNRNDLEDILEQAYKRLNKKGKLFIRLIDKRKIDEEFDSKLFNVRRWFVYFKKQEVISKAEIVGFHTLFYERNKHMQFDEVNWLSFLFEKR